MEEKSPLLVKKLYCVEYPGNVRDPARMIETLGGISSISNVGICIGRVLNYFVFLFYLTIYDVRVAGFLKYSKEARTEIQTRRQIL
jgi:hypothetical protein